MTPAQRKAAQQAEAQRQWVEQHVDGASTHYHQFEVSMLVGDVIVTAPIITSIHRIGPGPDRPEAPTE